MGSSYDSPKMDGEKLYGDALRMRDAVAFRALNQTRLLLHEKLACTIDWSEKKRRGHYMYWKRRNSRFFSRRASFCRYVFFLYCTIPGTLSLFDSEFAMVALFSGSIDVDACSSCGMDV